ncbi:MAG: signal peptidase I [Eubacteriales bacterium]|nr:signal peptidase I [Eubacteriales bacterium]
MKTLKNIFLKIINAVAVVIIIFAIFVLFNVFFTKSGDVPNIGGYSVFRVLTGSMEPTMPVDTLIVVKRCGPEKIEVGDVISFYSVDEDIYGSVNTHRVTGIEETNGYISFRTRGDANAAEDKNLTPGSELIGKVVFQSLLMGKIVRLTSNPIVFIPLILIPLFVILISNIVTTIKIAGELANEEVDEKIKEISEKRAADRVVHEDIDEADANRESGSNCN